MRLEPNIRGQSGLLVRIGQKEHRDPMTVCCCFGVTRRDIWTEIEQKGSYLVDPRARPYLGFTLSEGARVPTVCRGGLGVILPSNQPSISH